MKTSKEPKKRKKPSKKGGKFERDMSRKLSLWWSYGNNDDLIWRSS
jgi:hypothetical protein